MAHDSCASALDITSLLPYSDTVDTTGNAGAAGPSGNGFGWAFETTIDKSFWLTITPAEDMRIWVKTDGTDYDNYIQAYSGTCGGLTAIDANYEYKQMGPVDTSRLYLDLTAGTAYFIAIGDNDSGAGGSLQISVEQTYYPAFKCINAVTSQGGPTTVNNPGAPKRVSSGDHIFVFLSHKSADWVTPPAGGWTVLQRDISGAIRGELYYKVATGSEPTTWDFTHLTSGNIAATGFALAVRGGTVDGSSVQVNASGSVGAPSVTTVHNRSWVFGFTAFSSFTFGSALNAALWATGSPSSLTMEEIEDGGTTNGADAGFGYAAAQLEGAGVGTGNLTYTGDLSLGDNVGFLLVVGADAGFVVPTPGPYEEIENVSDPCCSDGSVGPTTGQTGEIPTVDPYGPHVPGTSTTTCVGEGDVPTAADLTDPEDWTTLLGKTPNVICELVATKHPATLGSTTYLWADQGHDLPLESTHVEGRVRRGGWLEIRRAMALPDQYPEISRAGVAIDEQDGLIRTLLDTDSTAYLRGREWLQSLVSETRRKAAGTMMALFRGVVSAFNPGPGRTYVIEAEDQITALGGIFDHEKLVPQAVIDYEFFGPGGDDGTDIHPTRYPGEHAGHLTRGAHKDLIGTPLPILGGICSDRGALSIDGQSAEKGAVPLIWTRDCYLPGHLDQIFGELLICIGEVAGIEDVFASDVGYDDGGMTPASPPRASRRININATVGVDLFTPEDVATWPFATRYRERTVGTKTLRYMAVYLRGPRMEDHRLGLCTAAANVCGPMGVNEQVITQAGPFLQWFFNEHVAANQGQGYRSGDYHTLATYASDATVPYVQPTTFDAFQDYTKDRMGDTIGYVVQNFQLRERITLRELEKRFMQDYEVSFPFNRHGQKMVRWIDDLADPTTGTLYRERIEMDEPMPPFRDAHDEVENKVGFVCDYDHDLQQFRREAEFLQDDNSIEAHYGVFEGGRRLSDGQSPQPFEVYSTGDIPTVRDAFQRRLLRKRKAPRYQEHTTDLQGLHDELGDQIRLTHTRGVGATGYDERPFYLLEHRIDPNRKRVTLRGMDITALVYGVGVWTEDADPDWDGSSVAQRVANGFWSEDDSTIPSDDAPAKEWR